MKVFYSRADNLIITGFSGFIGKSFIEYFSLYGETVDLEAITESATIIHLAALADISNNDISVIKNNVNLDIDVVNVALRYNHKLIYISTNNVYRKQIECDIDQDYFPKDQYSLSKVFGEKITSLLPPERFVILRLADVFGHGQNHGNFFKALENGLRKTSTFVLSNTGSKLRSYIYIKELVLLLNHIVTSDVFDGGIFNICHSQAYALKDILKEIEKKSDLSVEYKVMDEIDTSHDFRTMKQSEVNGYCYKFTLESALSDYIMDIKKETQND